MTSASAAQHGIWFTEEAGLAGTAYHLGLAIRFDGDLDVEALRSACERVVSRHPLLHAAFAAVDGELRIGLGERPPVRVTALTDTLVADEMARPYDLRKGPLARFTIASSSPDRHLLVVTAHHLVFDGMSKEILASELAAAYQSSQPDSLGLPVAAEADLDAAREFWQARWREPGQVILPGLHRLPVAAEPGGSVEWLIDEDLSRRLDAAAGAAGVTRFEFLLAALLALLGRYANPTPVVGIDVSTRTPDTTDHIGHFVNEIPVFAPPATGTFTQFAAAVRATCRESYPYRAAPVARVLGGQRPRPSLTPVSMSYRRSTADVKFAGVDATVDWMVAHHAARNALHVQVVDEGTDARVSMRYSPAAIDDVSAGRVAGHLRRLLEAAVKDPHTPVARLPLLTDAEVELIRRANDTTVAYPRTSVTDLVAESVRATPDAIAVVSGSLSLTYRELDERVAAAAGALAARGAGPGTLIGVCLPRSIEMLVAMLAVMRCGAAYLPMDAGHPPQRRATIAQDARPLFVIDGPLEAGPAAEARHDAGDLAYVIYTSGSTGQPKGVEVSQANLVNLLLGMRDALSAGDGDIWLALTSPAFDISALELLLPLITGARLVIAPDERDPAGVAGLIAEQGVTHVQATPSGWQLLLDAGVDVPLTVALAGGEALPGALAARLRGVAGRVVNVYGPTETTIWSTLDDVGDGAVTIGRPIANTSVHVLDLDLQPVPVDVPGELCIGGAGVAPGYRDRPELTGDRFIDRDGERLYRTGDVARWRADGRLEFLGRRDDQVKIRGHRVELSEIEARLLEVPGVRQAAVAMRDERLIAYVVGEDADPPGVLAHLHTTLPAAIVPASVAVLAALPLTPNGKLDRAALPDPPAAPRSPAQEAPAGIAGRIREIWQEVLQITDIGLDEDIFDLGGHSVLVMRIISRIRRQLGVDVPIEVFMDIPTIRGLTDAITSYQESLR